MTGMDMLLASLTPQKLAERTQGDALDHTLVDWVDEIEAAALRWLIEDLEKRIRE